MRDLLEVKGLFTAIESTTLTTVKGRIIQENKDNKLFKYCLKFLVSSDIVTGISKKKIGKKLNLNLANIEFNDIVELCEYVLKNNTGTDQVIINVQNYIEHQPEELREFISGLITKSIKLGANAKLINKAIPGLIFEFGVMLAESYDKNKNRVKGKRIIITTKLDGIRIVAVKEGNNVKFYSRQGKEIEGLIEIEKDILNIDGSFVLDGELIAEGEFANSQEQFTETMKRSRIKGEKTGLKMMCYDYISDVDDFCNGIDSTPCEKRKLNLESLIRINSNRLNHIEYLEPLYIGDNLDMIEKYSQIAAENGDEGNMINIADSPYECKRVKNLLKVKVFNSCDIKCLRVELGEGKYSNVVGKLICDYKGFELGVGSGLTDELRKLFIEHPEEVVGRVIEVNYFEELNTDGKLSVRFPSFKSVRDLGKEVSYN